MHGSRLVTALAAVFGAMTVVFLALGAVYSPVFLVVAALFGAVTYLTWYHASGRMAARLYRGVEQQAARNGGETGAGPREAWEAPRDGQTAAEAAGVGAGRPGGTAGARAPGGRDRSRRRRERDYEILGLEPGADEDAITEAYRERVKEVHPDAEGGSEAQFKRVKGAYERLTGEAEA